VIADLGDARQSQGIVDPIPTELGDFAPVFIEPFGRLSLYRPPAENLIVSKRIHCEPRDLSDIRFLVSRYRPDMTVVRRLVAGLTPHNRDLASENLVYLSVSEP
jgi:hypothetical protein